MMRDAQLQLCNYNSQMTAAYHADMTKRAMHAELAQKAVGDPEAYSTEKMDEWGVGKKVLSPVLRD